LNGNPSILELREIAFGYRRPDGAGREEVLAETSLKAGAGEGVAIVGPSGCGKSTLLEIIGTLLIPESGSVIFNGREVSALSEQERALFRNQDLGFIFQSHRLLPQCSALENVLLPTLAAPQRIDPDQEHKKASSLLERVGLEDRLQHRPHELSMGQRQRVAVARSLMNDPTLLLADEPTGSLDKQNSRALLELLDELRREMGLTMLLVTHDPNVATAMDRIVELRDGRLHNI